MQIPDGEGLAGAFVGISADSLVFAGGANFPGKKPWEGGRKAWHDKVFVLSRPDGEWKQAGTLPSRLAYGIAGSHRGRVICVGGSDAERHFAETFSLEVTRGGAIRVSPLPSLPFPLANACGAIVGDRLYVVGGQRRPDSTSAESAIHVLDLSSKESGWSEIEALPGPGRILAAAASLRGELCVSGGAGITPTGRRYFKDAYCFRPGKGWRSIADMPYPVAAAPSPAPADARGFYILGGDDGSKAGFEPLENHPGFRRTILWYESRTDRWLESGAVPFAPVTTSCVRWKGRWTVPSGEIRPGVRSPQVWSFLPTANSLERPW